MIRLTRYKEPPVQVTDPALMFRLIRASFNQRRKTLQNGLNNSPELSYTKEDIAEAIAGLDLPASVRGGSADAGAVCSAGQLFHGTFLERMLQTACLTDRKSR